MNNHIQSILSAWLTDKESSNWAMASIVNIEGSSYRKLGAMMLINEEGNALGMLSGGCLEADIILKAQKSIFLNKPAKYVYEADEQAHDSIIKFLGCGGVITILIQPLTVENNFQDLENLHYELQRNKKSAYIIDSSLKQNNSAVCIQNQTFNKLKSINSERHIFQYSSAPNLAIFGAGLDAIPMVNLAKILGWNIYLVDHRKSHVSSKLFPAEVTRIKQEMVVGDPNCLAWLNRLDAAIVMGHNMKFDAYALALLAKSETKYVGLLGPRHRTEKILADIKVEINYPLHNPIGLNIGTELPEEIALSAISEIQAVLNNKTNVLVSKPAYNQNHFAKAEVRVKP